MPRWLAMAFLLSSGATPPLRAQVVGLIGRWVPVDGLPTVWDFDGRGSLTATVLALPGASGTYRFDGRHLTMIFSDQTTVTAEVSFIGDTMLVRRPQGEARLTRTRAIDQDTVVLHGTWADQYGQFRRLTTYRPDGGFVIQMGMAGSYSVAGDVVTVTFPNLPAATQRYRVTIGGPDTTLVPLDTSATPHPSVWRRAR